MRWRTQEASGETVRPKATNLFAYASHTVDASERTYATEVGLVVVNITHIYVGVCEHPLCGPNGLLNNQLFGTV